MRQSRSLHATRRRNGGRKVSGSDLHLHLALLGANRAGHRGRQAFDDLSESQMRLTTLGSCYSRPFRMASGLLLGRQMESTLSTVLKHV